MTRAKKVDVAKHVQAVAAKTDKVPLMDALLDIVRKRIKRSAPRSPTPTMSGTPFPAPAAKARHKKRTDTRNRVYEVLRTWHGARQGSKRARQLDIVLAYTNTRSARAAGAESVDFTYAEEIGLIKFV